MATDCVDIVDGHLAYSEDPFYKRMKEYNNKLSILEKFLKDRLGINPEDIYKEKL